MHDGCYYSFVPLYIVAVSSGLSFLLSLTLAVLLFAGMQLYKVHLASHEWTTIVGGFLGSLLFCLVLTVSVVTETSYHVCFDSCLPWHSQERAGSGSGPPP